MATDVGIRITAQDDTARAFSSAQRSMAGLKSEAEALQNSIASSLGKFGSIALVVGAAFETASLKSIIDLGDRIDDLAEKTGISAKELSQWRYASEVAGTSLEGLTTGISKLTKNMASAAGGSKEQIAAFEAIGVSVKTASGALRSTDEVLGDVANKFASYADGPEKAALAMELFGKSGQDMIPILNKGSQGIAELRGEAVALGAVFGDDLAKQSGEFNDNLKRIAISGEALKIKIAGQLLPALNSLAEAFVESRKGGSGFADMMGTGLKTVLETVSVLGSEVAFVFKGIGTEIGGIAAQAAALAKLDFKGVASIGAAMREDAAAARAAQDASTRRLSGIKDSTRGAGFADPRILGDTGSIEAQTRAWRDAAPIIKKAADAAKEAASAYDSLNLSMQQRLTVLQAELAGGRKLTEGEKYDADMRTKLADATTKLTDGERKRLATTLEIVTAKSKLVEVQQRELKAAQDAFAITTAAQDETLKALREEEDQRNKIRLTVMASTQSTQEAVELAQLEATSIFNTAEDRKKILDYYRIELDLRNKIKAINANGGLDQSGRDELIAIEEASAARLKGVADLTAGTSRTASIIDSIDQTAHTVWTNVLEGGVNAFQRIGQTIKAAVLDLLYQITIKKWILSIGASVTGGAATAQGVTGSGILGSASNALSSMFPALASGLSQFSTAALASAQSLVGMTGTAAQAQMAVTGGLANATGASTLGTTLGTAMPYIAAAVAAYYLVNKFSETTKPSIEGGYASTGTTGAANGKSYVDGNYGGAIDSAAKTIVTDLTTTYSSFVKSLGGKVGSLTAQSFIGIDGNGGGKGSQNALSLDAQLNGQWLFNRWTEQGGNINAGTTTEEMSAAVKLSSEQILIKALQATDLGPALNDYLATVTTAGKTLAELDATLADVSGFAAFRDAVRSLPFDYLVGASVNAEKAILQAAGGLDAFKSSVGNYLDLFYSDTEKTAIKTKSLSAAFADVGVTMPALGEGTRAWYRSLVDSLGAQDLTIEANAKAYTAALALAGAVNELAPAAQTVAAAVGSAAAAITRSASDIANERSNLETQLLQAQGDTAGLRAKTLAALDASNRAIQEQIFALEDQAKATAAAATAAKDAAQAQLDAAATAKQARADAVTSAKSIFDRAAATERDRLNNIISDRQAAVATLQSVFDLLKSSTKDLYSQVASTAATSAAQGRAYISTALALAKAGGVSPDQAALSDAIAAARAGLDAGQYASQFEADRARLILAGELSQLKDAAGDQLTTAERALVIEKDQLTALDKMVRGVQDMIDAANGIDVSIHSLSEAFASLSNAIGAQKTAGTTATAAKPTGTYATSGASFGAGTGAAFLPNAAPYSYSTSLGLGGSIVTPVADVGAFITALDWGNPEAVAKSVVTSAEFAKQNGLSQAEVAASLGLDVDTVRANMAAYGIPAFATGTNYVPRDMLALIHEGEEITPKAYNPAAGGRRLENSQDLINAVRALEVKLAQIAEATKATAGATSTVASIEQDRQIVPQRVEAIT